MVGQPCIKRNTCSALYLTFSHCLVFFHSEKATKVMIELLGTYTEDNASQARDDAQR